MICTNGLFPTHRITKLDGAAILDAAGYTKQVATGLITLLPFAVIVLRNITDEIRRIYEKYNFAEISLPLLQKCKLWEESGRISKYKNVLCETKIGNNQRYVINATQEEAVLDLFRSSTFRANDLPLCLFHIGERARNEIRPAHGLIRARCFVLADAYALCHNAEQMEEVSQDLEKMLIDVAEWIGFSPKKGLYYPLPMESKKYSFWIPSTSKQCLFFVCHKCDISYRTHKEMPKSCPNCLSLDFSLVDAIEIGDVVNSGIVLSNKMNVHVAGTKDPVHVTLMGIGIYRLLQVAAEYYHDQNGLTWPIRIAPYVVQLITTVEREREARELYTVLEIANCKTLFDLRNLPIGRKLVDADLFGIPIRIVIGNKTRIGNFDVKERKTGRESIMDKEKILNYINELKIEEAGK